GRDRLGRGRRSIAVGALGEKLGVAFVQPRDGVAQLAGSEHLVPPESASRLDLEQGDELSLVHTDVERRTGEPAGRRWVMAQREGVSEDGQWLMPTRRVLGA